MIEINEALGLTQLFNAPKTPYDVYLCSKIEEAKASPNFQGVLDQCQKSANEFLGKCRNLFGLAEAGWCKKRITCGYVMARYKILSFDQFSKLYEKKE